MRITNKIIRTNSLENISAAKMSEDKLMKQMSTGQKITKPSDDPVIAIRALRLRSALTDITQYYEKNVEEAESWLDLTESAVTSLEDALEDMIEQCNKGSNKDLQSVDRQAILDALKYLRDEIYATGEVDCAGRGLFTGYRTGTKLRFEADETKYYEITETFRTSEIEDITYVKLGTGVSSLDKIDGSNFNAQSVAGTYDYAIDETDVFQSAVHRFRLSYDDLDVGNDIAVGGKAGVTFSYQKDGAEQEFTSGSVSLSEMKDAAGNPVDPYLYVQELEEAYGAPAAILIPETGEVILGNETYKSLSAAEGEISITYRKSEWEKNDLRPEHYFTCTEWPDGYGDTSGKGPTLHNADGIGEQVMEYDVGFNQAVRVNTMASECYTPDIGRDIDDLINLMEQVGNVENAVSELTKAKSDSNLSQEDREQAGRLLTSAQKAMTFLNEKLQTLFEASITKMQTHLNVAGIAKTNVGTRSSKLALVKERLMSQQSNFKDLVKDNEQADEAAVATDLKSAKFSYDAALMATGQMTENSLLDFI